MWNTSLLRNSTGNLHKKILGDLSNQVEQPPFQLPHPFFLAVDSHSSDVKAVGQLFQLPHLRIKTDILYVLFVVLDLSQGINPLVWINARW
jgi:hypothetical protein